MSLARKSPLRKVEHVQQVGKWGDVRYLHLLDCGHTDERKRRVTDVRCVKCYEPPAEFTNEAEVRVCQLRLASALNCSPEDVNLNVDATNGTLQLKGAVVWLSGEQVRRLIRRRPNS